VGEWLIVFLLVAIVGCLFMELIKGGASASAQVTATPRTGKILAAVGQIGDDGYGLYLVDLERGIIALYQWAPKTRKLRLLAARNCVYDLQLDEYNTEPSPIEIRNLVRESQPLGETGSR
jgi:hypothetical protein